MNTRLWAYTEECEGKPCCGDCDKCRKALEEAIKEYEEQLEWDYMAHTRKPVLSEEEDEEDDERGTV